MARPLVLVAWGLLALLASPMVASAAIVEHSFNVENMVVKPLCKSEVITAVNGRMPGPTIRVREGDTLVVHVYNKSPYNITIHWHGVLQILSCWADGPNMVTQCPIGPGRSYTYKFNVIKQEGTLWWHAHASWLRATVYGALVILPRLGHSYPFPKPYKEFPILLGEWWNANIVDVVNRLQATGSAPNSDAYTINGKAGKLYRCRHTKTHTIRVVEGKTYLLRIINAALNNQLFFKIANHMLTVVAVDASYTNPYVTDVVLLGPGQTTDVLLTADQSPGSYYMAARAYQSAANPNFDNTTTTGILIYNGTEPKPPVMPVLPAFNDTPTAFKFDSNITSLVDGPHWFPVPGYVDEHMFVTVGLGTDVTGKQLSASMNNASFVLPTKLSLLQASFFGVNGIFTDDFPDNPPVIFDYTNPNVSASLLFAPRSTKVKRLRFNSTVEMVLQNTALIAVENHPIHLHGHNFHVLAQGFGNYDPMKDREKFNLVDSQIRNTIGVPVGGWAVIRFQANNPGAWIFHCHLDVHLLVGLATAFVVDNGPTPWSTLPPPPPDLPHC